MNAVREIRSRARPQPRSVLLSHPHGNANVREVASALEDAGLLAQFWTGLAWDPDAAWARAVPARARRQLERRAYPPRVRPYVRVHPWREAARLAAVNLRLGALARHPGLSPNACHESLDLRVARVLECDPRIRAVYAYDHGALASFEVAARTGRARIYDLPIGYWRALEATIREEAARWPEWRAATPAIDFDTPTYVRKDEELVRADHVVVPSRFVEATLRAHRAVLPRVHVVPFGAPPAQPLSDAALDPDARRSLRVLYVGALDLRKGIPYLFDAVRMLGASVEFTVVGRPAGESATLRRRLAAYRWYESLPREEVLALMRTADVFLFPTLFEGMALVVLEAMAQGCVVVTTSNSGADGVITDGVDGCIVPLRDPHALAAAVMALDADRVRLAAMRRAAQARAARQTWDVYRTGILRVVEAALA